MRTAIFVFETSTLSIHTLEANLKLEKLRGATVPLLESHTLEPGFYKVQSRRSITVRAENAVNVDIVTVNDKDDVPEPRPKLQGHSVPVMTEELEAAFHKFYETNKGVDDDVMNGANLVAP